MREYRIKFPEREKRLDKMIKDGLLYEFKFIKTKKNINKLYKQSNGKN